MVTLGHQTDRQAHTMSGYHHTPEPNGWAILPFALILGISIAIIMVML